MTDQDRQVQAAMDRYIRMVADQNEQDRVVREARCKLGGHSFPNMDDPCVTCGAESAMAVIGRRMADATYNMAADLERKLMLTQLAKHSYLRMDDLIYYLNDKDKEECHYQANKYIMS